MDLEKKILEELEKSPLLKALISAAPEHAIIFDFEGKVQARNERMARFLHETPNISFSVNSENNNICQVSVFDQNCKFLSVCKDCLFQNLISEVRKNKIPILNQEGFLNVLGKEQHQRISIIFNVFPFEFEGKDYVIFGFRDIDNIKEYEKSRINDMKKLSTIGESVAAIVHDLKNPLTGLFGYLELMKIKENKMEFIPKMENALEIIRTTLEDVLALTIEEENIVLNKKYEDIKEMVIDVIALLRIEEITHLDIKGKTIAYVDKVKFHNVLWNLLKNANEALVGDDEEIRVKIYKEEKSIVVEISDTGKGIPEENKAKLFKVGKTFGKNNGTGFGLVNAKKIVEAHGGIISFSSEIGKGTKFLVKIPNDS